MVLRNSPLFASNPPQKGSNSGSPRHTNQNATRERRKGGKGKGKGREERKNTQYQLARPWSTAGEGADWHVHFVKLAIPTEAQQRRSQERHATEMVCKGSFAKRQVYKGSQKHYS